MHQDDPLCDQEVGQVAALAVPTEEEELIAGLQAEPPRSDERVEDPEIVQAHIFPPRGGGGSWPLAAQLGEEVIRPAPVNLGRLVQEVLLQVLVGSGQVLDVVLLRVELDRDVPEALLGSRLEVAQHMQQDPEAPIIELEPEHQQRPFRQRPWTTLGMASSFGSPNLSR